MTHLSTKTQCHRTYLDLYQLSSPRNAYLTLVKQKCHISMLSNYAGKISLQPEHNNSDTLLFGSKLTDNEVVLNQMNSIKELYHFEHI